MIGSTPAKPRPHGSIASFTFSLVALLLPQPATAGSVADVQAFFTQLHARGEFSGSVLIADGENILLHAAYGFANEETRAELEPNTPHRIASVTKGFTAVLALQAVERGEIALDDPMVARFPNLQRPELARITVRHLLTHGSGLVDFAPEPQDGETMTHALTRALMTAEIGFAPGERFSYVNVNYTIVAAILEQATRRSYADLLHERILQPAGMESTYLDVSDAPHRSRAVGYKMQDGALVRNEETRLERFLGAGNIVSTTEDLFRLSRALVGDTLLSAASRELMQTPQQDRYAIGCVIMKPPTGETAQLFLGGMPGTSAVLARFDDGQRTIVILSNRSNAPTNRIIPQVHRLLATP